MLGPILLKVPGVSSSSLEKLLSFINSDANRPITDVATVPRSSDRRDHRCYVTLLSAEEESKESKRYKVALTILAEHGVRDGHGGSTKETPRVVIETVLDILARFPIAE